MVACALLYGRSTAVANRIMIMAPLQHAKILLPRRCGLACLFHARTVMSETDKIRKNQLHTVDVSVLSPD